MEHDHKATTSDWPPGKPLIFGRPRDVARIIRKHTVAWPRVHLVSQNRAVGNRSHEAGPIRRHGPIASAGPSRTFQMGRRRQRVWHPDTPYQANLDHSISDRHEATPPDTLRYPTRVKARKAAKDRLAAYSLAASPKRCQHRDHGNALECLKVGASIGGVQDALGCTIGTASLRCQIACGNARESSQIAVGVVMPEN